MTAATIDTRQTRDSGPGWHEHYPGETRYTCPVCRDEDRLELEQRGPIPEWARNGGGLVVERDGSTGYAVAPNTLGANRYPDIRPADHGLDRAACAELRTAHVHYATTIGYPRGYWPDAPREEQRA